MTLLMLSVPAVVGGEDAKTEQPQAAEPKVAADKNPKPKGDAKAVDSKKADAKKAEPKDGEAKAPKAKAKPKPKGGNGLANLLIQLGGGRVAPNADMMINQNQDAIKQMALQFQQQYRGLLGEELQFLRMTIDIPPEHRPKIKAAGEAAIEAVALKQAEGQFNPRGNVQNQGPERLVRDSLLKALEEVFTEEQLKTFREESQHRLDHRRRTAIEAVVCILDSQMYLSEAQRTAITASLNDNWQESWEVWLMLPAYNSQYLPTIPDQFVVKHLKPDQKTIWQTSQKITMSWFDQFGDGQADMNWWDEVAGK